MNIKWSFLLRFLLIAGGIAGTATWVTGHALSAPFPAYSPGWWGGWAWAAALWVFPLTRTIFFRERQVSGLQSLAFFLIGLGATNFLLLLLVKLAGLVLGLAGLGFGPWVGWAVLAMSLLLAVWGWQAAMGPASAKHLTLTHTGLHPDLEGLRIVQLSDLHVSHLQGRAQVQRLVDQVAALAPDLIAITGDLVDGPLESLRHAVEPLAGLRAPLGVHYVTGNHEYFWGAEGWKDQFSGMGFEVLSNEHRLMRYKGARLLVMGVDDPTASRFGADGGPDLARAMQGAPEADYTLFLAHQPGAYAMAEDAKADLFLAGHTHGGQFFPFPPIVSLFHKYFHGLYRHSERLWVYVHPGSGFWGPPNRLGVPPEIAVLELARA